MIEFEKLKKTNLRNFLGKLLRRLFQKLII